MKEKKIIDSCSLNSVMCVTGNGSIFNIFLYIVEEFIRRCTKNPNKEPSSTTSRTLMVLKEILVLCLVSSLSF